jgi:hypothetical protein
MSATTTGTGSTGPTGPTGPATGTAPRVRRGGLGIWARDLAMGARFAVAGGPQGWLRTLLTAVGVALGVALLLVASSVPEINSSRDARGDARAGAFQSPAVIQDKTKPTPYSVLSKDANTSYHGDQLTGRLLQAEGSSPAAPPGVEHIPGPGQMLVSPALKQRLAGPDGKELRKRLDGHVVGTIGDAGLIGPQELAFYKGADHLSVEAGAQRTNSFSDTPQRQPLDPALLLLVVVACAVLVMPVAVFIATAVRFGGEQRDARLAALRLVGADAKMARRMAAGEALAGTLFGMLLGGGLFLFVRALIGHIEMFGLSVFPGDIVPTPLLALLIVVGVPLAAIAVTVLALRGVAIEPLGLVRQGIPRRRRLWWRLVPPVGGAALLLPLAGSAAGDNASVNEPQVTAAIVLLLSGVALLLPWLVERIVARLRGGGLSWQLATRRLQLSSGNATRAVSGITIAVAGAIALQMIFAAVQQKETHPTGLDPQNSTASIFGQHSTVAGAAALTADLKRTEGVKQARGSMYVSVPARGISSTDESLTIANCATVRTLVKTSGCHNGQVFLAGSGDGTSSPPHPGETLLLNKDDPKGPPIHPGGGDGAWRVPASARSVKPVEAANGSAVDGVIATPGALSEKRIHDGTFQGLVVLDQHNTEAIEHVRTTLFHHDPAASVFQSHSVAPTAEFVSLKRTVFLASVAVLLLIGASMVVSQLEQLRERKRQLSVLVAFGTRRSTLGASVLWQTAIPVVLGIALSVVFGLGLGWGLLRLLGAPSTDWLVFLPVAGAGIGVIALVTLVSLPSLWRMMRPDGLRTE